MGYSSFTRLCFLYATILLVFSVSISETASSNLLDLVYKGCSSKSFQTSAFQTNLVTLLDSLIARASASKFFANSLGTGENSIRGLFQCRGDLDGTSCSNCVKQLCQQVNHLCGNTIAARIQFQGCYLLYETVDFPKTPDSRVLYSTCNAVQSTDGSFHQKRETAFANLESGLLGGSGFSTLSYGGIYALGQCQGDVGVADCGECVKTAIQSVETQCGDSISGQVYLQKCYLSYNYLPSGVSRKASSGTSQGTGKTVAIVVGGAAAVFLGFAVLLFIRSLLRKKDDNG